MSKTTTIIGPADVGRRMTLEEFIYAEGQGGSLYELSRGIVTMVDVPNPRHLKVIHAIRRQFDDHDRLNPGRIWAVAGGGECRMLIKSLESDRHPDLAVYKTPPPDSEKADEIWSRWIPEIVIEIVSPGSRFRDYQQKPDEYFQFGVQEYWIIDAREQTMTALRRSGGSWDERIVKAPDLYQTTVLPGLEFSIAAVFEAR